MALGTLDHGAGDPETSLGVCFPREDPAGNALPKTGD